MSKPKEHKSTCSGISDPRKTLMQQVACLIALVFVLNSSRAESFNLTDTQARRFSEFKPHDEDIFYWRNVFSNGITNITEEAFAEHLSFQGREEIYHPIHYDEYVSPVLLNILTDLAISYVQHCEEFLSHPLNSKKIHNAEIFERELSHWEVSFFQDMAARLEIDRPLAEKLLLQVKPPNFWVGHTLARNPSTPQDILETLSGSQFDFALDLALNPNAPTNILWRLLTDKKVEQAKVALASRSTTDAALLFEWATNDDKKVRIAVGRNTNAPTALLLQLSNDTNAEVRLAASFGLARSPNTPLSILQDLARHARDDVQIAVARNPIIPRELLEEILNNQSYQVWIEAFRVFASQNPAPKELLRKRLQAADGIEHRWFSDEKGLPEWVHQEF
jgi:hypothetical protein